ncbi:hypothetical protein ACJ2A9_13395 [Anaerobacillus sp. MEB173]|uniref:hypothetical protein n=1 Tax=Anaerobacillus sp. MEB173 TaxID=3383345 RepID=UPI003F9113CC
MQEIQLFDLVQSVSPKWLPLLREDEQSMLVVLQYGLGNLSETDLKEIIGAAIMEQHKEQPLYH